MVRVQYYGIYCLHRGIQYVVYVRYLQINYKKNFNPTIFYKNFFKIKKSEENTNSYIVHPIIVYCRYF